MKRLIVLALLAGCASHASVVEMPAFTTSDTTAITDVLAKQAAAWNRGDLGGYMDGYAKLDTIVFTSGGKITRGWQPTFDRFQKRYGSDPTTMGQLEVSDVEVTSLGADGAIALGHWKLTGAEHNGGGVFSLGFARRPEGWKIVHDHTSSSSPTPESLTGIAECDQYVAAVDKLALCNTMPVDARGQMKDGVDGAKDAWRSLSPEDKRTAADGCKAAVDAIAQASAAYGCS